MKRNRLITVAKIAVLVVLLLQSFTTANAFSSNNGTAKPTLVVGATGKVGRLVVKQLLEQNKEVRALVRDATKAKEIFQQYSNNNLQIIVCDIGKYQDPKQRSIMEDAINGVDAIISVSGTMRFSKLMDFFPPWKLFNEDISSWCDDKSHPYYTNYKAQCLMVDIASNQDRPPKFVRLTGLSTGFSTFNLFTLIFSSLLSMSSRYHYLFEQYLKTQNKVPYVILRPGGLADEERDFDKTFLQVEPSGYLPAPGRVPRVDVAALAVQACTVLPDDSRYTLAIRAVGEMKPKPQGEMSDGSATAEECLVEMAKSTPSEEVLTAKVKKPYGVAVGIFVYSLVVAGFTVSTALVQWIFNFF